MVSAVWFLYIIVPLTLDSTIRKLRHLSYYTSTQTVALTAFGIVAGVIMGATQQYKWMFVVGLAVRLFGVGLMIHSRGAKGNTTELVVTQVCVRDSAVPYIIDMSNPR
jgi:hypothetical protein